MFQPPTSLYLTEEKLSLTTDPDASLEAEGIPAGPSAPFHDENRGSKQHMWITPYQHWDSISTFQTQVHQFESLSPQVDCAF